MRALITGASAGIGRDIAREFASRGIDLVVVARRADRLEELKRELSSVDVKIIVLDLGTTEACFSLHEQLKSIPIDILVNNAGFGVYGDFLSTDLNRELEMLHLNIQALHILTKLFYKDFCAKDSGYILNIASAAGFLPGPLFSSYYASKAYVLRLSEALYEEARQDKRNISISVFCPGPVKTEFGKVADAQNIVSRGITSPYAAAYAVKKMFEHKLVIVPTVLLKLARFFSKILPDKLLLKAAYQIQSKK